MKYSWIIVALLILALYYTSFHRFSAFNTSRIKACDTGPVRGGDTTSGTSSNTRSCAMYNIHNLHKDQKEAAALMHQIVKSNDILLKHLEKKYLNSEFTGGMDPNKMNRIDVIPMSGVYSESELKYPDREELQERIQQLLDKYHTESIYEISPLNKSGATSYSENKGQRLVFCLRKKTPNSNGVYELHDINIMIFVSLHELAHIMNDKWGHRTDFWQLFKFLLENAVEVGIYKPVNYVLSPINYCGLNINYCPLYDRSL